MGTFTVSYPDFGDLASLSLTVYENRFVLTVNGVVKYDGIDAQDALNAFHRYAPKMRYRVISRTSLGLPNYQ